MLDEILAALQQAGLITPAGATPEPEYLFRHALIQDAAYASLLKADRRALHLAVGETLERQYAERLEEHAPLLAHHFEEAGDDQRALRYFRMAGDAALRGYARAEAVLHYDHALALAQHIQADAPTMRHLFISRGRALELSGRHAEALDAYAELEALAQERQDRSLELAALTARIPTYATFTPFYNPPHAETIIERALELARAIGDREAEARLLWNRLLLYVSTQRLQEAVVAGEEALALARQEGLRELQATILNDLGRGYLFLSQLERGFALVEEARGIWRALGNLPMLAETLNNVANHQLRAGFYDDVLRLGQEAYEVSLACGNAWGRAYSQLLVCPVYAEQGRFDLALAAAEEAREHGRAAGFLYAVVVAGSYLAVLYGQLGALERGFAMAHQTLALARQAITGFQPLPMLALIGLHTLAGQLDEAQALLDDLRRMIDPLRYIMAEASLAVTIPLELLLAQGRHAEALAMAHEVLDHCRAQGVTAEVKDLRLLQARALWGLGRLVEAEATLAEALAETAERGLAYARLPMLLLAAELAELRGAPAEARRQRSEARALVARMLATLPEPDLAAAWAAQPEIRALLDEQLS